jgi:methionine synthase II (cobalamin-independent)
VTYPWPAGAATGIGSLPGTDIVEAVKVVFGELPDFPHLPELPARGPGADMIGRGAGLLVDLPVEIYAGRWRVTARPGRDARVTRDLLVRDLDTVTVHAAEYTGPFKVASAGPWTLASSVQLPVGGALLRDPGAVRDLAASLAEGLRDHVADVAARLPGATVVLQLDEPSLPAVLAGRVPTESGFSTLPAPEPATVQGALAGIVEAVAVPVIVHCCAPGVPVGLVRETGAVAVAIDLDQGFDLDQVGEALDAGLGLLAGAAPALPPPSSRAPSPAEVAEKVRQLWRRLGFPAERLASQVVVSPACGLAGAPEDYARRVLTTCREAGQRLLES